MTIRQRVRFGTSLIVTASVSATAGTLIAERAGLIERAHAQTERGTKERKRKGPAAGQEGPATRPAQGPAPTTEGATAGGAKSGATAAESSLPTPESPTGAAAARPARGKEAERPTAHLQGAAGQSAVPQG